MHKVKVFHTQTPSNEYRRRCRFRYYVLWCSVGFNKTVKSFLIQFLSAAINLYSLVSIM